MLVNAPEGEAPLRPPQPDTRRDWLRDGICIRECRFRARKHLPLPRE